MSRGKGKSNTPLSIIDDNVAKQKAGVTRRELSEEYGQPYKTIKNIITQENNKIRRAEIGLQTIKRRGRKAAVTLQEYKYKKRLKK